MIKYLENVDPKDLDKKLQKALFYLDKASNLEIICTSGLRTPEHNAEIGGDAKSSHLEGLAVDFSCLESNMRFWLIYWALIAGFKRIGIAKDHIHLDLNTKKQQNIIFFE